MRRYDALVLMAALLVSSAHEGHTQGWGDSEYREFHSAAVASDAGPCSQVGVDVLRRLGGSAVDAAIATMLCVGVVNHQSSGVGGGHVVTIFEAPNTAPSGPKELMTLLARERAPIAAHKDMFVNATEHLSTVGGLAVAVPGEIAGFHAAWRRYGRIPWKDLFTGAIQLCREGFAIGRSLAEAIQLSEHSIRKDENLSELFVDDKGRLLQEGDTLTNPRLAATLANIATDPNAFYHPNSQLAKDIVADIADYGGILTVEDLAAYTSSWKPPLSVHLETGNLTVYGPPPPASGAVLQYILNILDGYRLSSADLANPARCALTYQRIIEAFKFAYAKRSHLGDEDFVDVQQLLHNLTSDEYAVHTRTRINDTHTQPVAYYEPDFEDSVDAGTAHACVLTESGAAVAITATINLLFGSKVRGSRTGIMFNDEMDDFSTPGLRNAFGLPPSPSNFIYPGKMPMSSMCPVIILDGAGKVRFLTGASGGTRITTSTAYVRMAVDGDVAVHTLWLGMRVDEATDIGRLHHQLVPNQISYEATADKNILDGLKAKGHKLNAYCGHIGTVQSIHNTCSEDDHWKEKACIHAVSDGRKGGIPDGY